MGWTGNEALVCTQSTQRTMMIRNLIATILLILDLRALAKKWDVELGANNNGRVIELHLMLWNEEFVTYYVSHMGL